MDIAALLDRQRSYFATGVTLPVEKRLAALRRLKKEIQNRESAIAEALQADLGKAPFESYMTETGMVLDELGYVEKHMPRWARPKRVKTPFAQFPAKSFILKEPYGVVLIMAPWNYPFQLSLEPLIGALAAGNCAVIKPSAYAPRTSQLIADLIAACFPPEYVAVVQGGRAENQALLEQKFDYIFFTGGIEVGKLVMEKAARHLTPVSLELGGKSPCIIDESADIPLAAKRLAFGKFLNAGQTCVAPDYVLVHQSVYDALVDALNMEIRAFFGTDPLACREYPQIINQKHFERLLGLLQGADILAGGQHDGKGRIAPTLLGGISAESPCMQEEIFGPLLPLLPYHRLEEAVEFVRSRPKPLALYLFTRNQNTEKQVLSTLSFGGGCVNDTIIHLATSRMGFGGVGASGMGSYHGRYSFDTFTHEKSMVKKSGKIDLPVRYHPYTDKNFRMLKKFLK